MARFTSIIVALLVASIATVEARPRPDPKCKQCISSPNNCDITAPCSNFLGSLYCGCQPGYKASRYIHNNDATKQWRITTVPGHEHRVWVAPGVKCDQLCEYPFGTNVCGEVAANDVCPP